LVSPAWNIERKLQLLLLLNKEEIFFFFVQFNSLKEL